MRTMIFQTPRIVALSGLSRSGKDTVADYMCATYGYNKAAFADKLKDNVATIFGISRAQLERDKDGLIRDQKLWPGWTYRRFMQYYGTELMRDNLGAENPVLGKNIWIYSLLNDELRERFRTNPQYRLIITDVRFKNESQAISDFAKSLGLMDISVFIERDTINSASTHISEKDMTGADTHYILQNNAELQELYDNVDRILLDFKYTDILSGIL